MSDIAYKNLIKYTTQPTNFTYWWRCDTEQLKESLDYSAGPSLIYYHNGAEFAECGISMVAARVGTAAIYSREGGYARTTADKNISSTKFRIGMWCKIIYLHDWLHWIADFIPFGIYKQVPELQEDELGAWGATLNISINNSGITCGPLHIDSTAFVGHWRFIEVVYDTIIQRMELIIDGIIIDSLVNHPGVVIAPIDLQEFYAILFAKSYLYMWELYIAESLGYVDNIMITSDTDLNLYRDYALKTSYANRMDIYYHGIEYSAPDPAPTITSITPNNGPNDTSINITNLVGTNFKSGATVKLSRDLYEDIDATNVVVVSDRQITCTFDLNGKAVGAWDVIVTNPDDKYGILEDGFHIINGQFLFWWRCDNREISPYLFWTFETDQIDPTSDHCIFPDPVITYTDSLRTEAAAHIGTYGASIPTTDNSITLSTRDLETPISSLEGRVGFWWKYTDVQDSFSHTMGSISFEDICGGRSLTFVFWIYGDGHTPYGDLELKVDVGDDNFLTYINCIYGRNTYHFIEVAWKYDSTNTHIDMALYIDGLNRETLLGGLSTPMWPTVDSLIVSAGNSRPYDKQFDNIMYAPWYDVSLYDYYASDTTFSRKYLPVIQEPEDYNTFNYVATYSANPSDFVEISERIIGNGSLRFNPSYSITLETDELEYYKSCNISFFITMNRPDVINDINVFSLMIGETVDTSIILKISKSMMDSYGQSHVKCEFYCNNVRMGDDDWYNYEEYDFGWINLKVGNGLFSVSGMFEFTGTVPQAKNMNKITLSSSPESPVYTYCLIDNFIMHSSMSVDMNKYRGFSAYTSIMPVDPVAPTEDIIFWLTGMKDEYNLPAYRYYEGFDYCYGYITYNRLPALDIADKIIDDANASFKGSTTFDVMKDNQVVPLDLSQARIGYWFTADENGWSPSVSVIGFDGPNDPEIMINPTEGHETTQFDVNIGHGSYIYARLQYPTALIPRNSYWAEIQVDTSVTPSVVNAWINTNACSCIHSPTIYDNSGNRWLVSYDTSGGIQNLIVSTNKDLDMWNTIYESTRLPYLTHYPRDTEVMRLGADATNIFKFVIFDGTTETKYDTELSLIDEEEHFIEYKYDIENRNLGLRIDGNNWAEVTIPELPTSVQYADMEFSLTNNETPPPPVGAWFVWYSADSSNIQAGHDYFIDSGVSSFTWMEAPPISASAAKVGVAGVRSAVHATGYIMGTETLSTSDGLRFGIWARFSPDYSINTDGQSGIMVTDSMGANMIAHALMIDSTQIPMLMFTDGNENTYVLHGNTAIPKDNTWHWIEGVFDIPEKNMILYLDNNLIGTRSCEYVASQALLFFVAANMQGVDITGNVDMDQFLVTSGTTRVLWDYRNIDGYPG